MVDNSAEEILAVTKEMVAKVTNQRDVSDADVSLQRVFKSLLPFSMIAYNEFIQENPSLFYIDLGTHFMNKFHYLIVAQAERRGKYAIAE